jgi:hypothetical protein
LHIHNVFPYLLIKPFKKFTSSELNTYMYELSKHIDFTLNMSLCIRDPNFSQHVYKIEPVYTKQEIWSFSFKKIEKQFLF